MEVTVDVVVLEQIKIVVKELKRDLETLEYLLNKLECR